VTVGSSPAWLKEKLEVVGQRSINSLVDIMNYVMLDTGQPMHVFDADKIEGQIQVRLAVEGEKVITLDNKEVSLSSADLVIADDISVLAIAGVKGGKKAEVDTNTKNIVIESANFTPTSIRRTSTRLNLRTDASKRFENEITPELALIGMQKAVELVLQVCGGTQGSVSDEYPVKAKKQSIEVSAKQISSIIGEQISEDEIKAILVRLGCEVESVEDAHLHGEVVLNITPPFERLDLVIPEDIADEVGRIRGYENLATVLPPPIEAAPIDKTFYYAEKTKNTLIELGFSEVMLYSLVAKGSYEILKPLADDKKFLRESIVEQMTSALSRNAVNADLLGLSDIKLFEIGKVFTKSADGENSSGEKTVLTLGVRKTKKKKGETADTILVGVLTELGIQVGSPNTNKIEIKEGVVEINFDAHIASLPQPKDISDLNFTTLPTDLRYKAFSVYPYMVRDIAVFVPEAVKADEVLSLLIQNAGELLVRHSLFDTFQKDGKVSYAFRFVFQSYERTLTDDETNRTMTSIVQKILEKGWEVR
jgi:phenylalanyl-tRNA synthetase beta chain